MLLWLKMVNGFAGSKFESAGAPGQAKFDSSAYNVMWSGEKTLYTCQLYSSLPVEEDWPESAEHAHIIKDNMDHVLETRAKHIRGGI